LIVEESGESQPVPRDLPEDLAAPCVILFPTSVFGHLLPDEARKVLTHVYGLAVVWLESLHL
jgi:hypothetical protein